MAWWLLLVIIIIIIVAIVVYVLVIERYLLYWPDGKLHQRPQGPFRSVRFNEQGDIITEGYHVNRGDGIHGWYFTFSDADRQSISRTSVEQPDVSGMKQPNIPTVHSSSEISGTNIHPYLNSSRTRGSKVVLYCHGSSGNISYCTHIIDICRSQELNLLLFDYPGYGISGGYPSSSGIRKSAQAAYNFLIKQGFDPCDIIVWGESLGGVAAIHIASTNPCGTLILLATFSSLEDILQDTNIRDGRGGVYRLLTEHVTRGASLVVDTMRNKERIKYVSCPVIIIHSRQDELIPYQNAVRLYDAVSHENKLLIPVQGGHISPHLSEDVLARVFRFCCLDSSKCFYSSDTLRSIRDRRRYGE